MNLRDRIVNLSTSQDVKHFLEHHPTSVIFKAGTCHKTMQGFGFLQEQLQDRDDLMVGIIRVLEARPASNLVAEMTGIIHHSPQVILFRDGEEQARVVGAKPKDMILREIDPHVPA
jgi:bacillithiol system protein YtxJ